jgi:hypothetical protein
VSTFHVFLFTYCQARVFRARFGGKNPARAAHIHERDSFPGVHTGIFSSTDRGAAAHFRRISTWSKWVHGFDIKTL